MTSENIHIALARSVLPADAKEEDALALMILLHTHHVWLRMPCLQDRPGVAELAAITQRHSAEVAAAVWPNRSDAERIDPRYWYHQFNARTPYEVVDDVPPDWLVRVERLRERLANNPTVERLAPED